jgi:ankyrin repeat protein
MMKSVQGAVENPAQFEQFRGVMALAEVMKNNKDTPLMFQTLLNDPQLSSAFKEMQTQGAPAIAKYYNDPDFLKAVSIKMGGLPSEVKAAIRTLPETIKAGDVEGVRKMLDSGVSPDAQDDKGISALHYAVALDRLDILKLLMDKKADPKVVDKDGNTLLHYAAGYGRLQTTEYFLQCGLPLNAQNNNKETPLACANRNKHDHVATLLKSRGAQ